MQGIAVVDHEEIRLHLPDIDQHHGEQRVYERADRARKGDEEDRVQGINRARVQRQEVIHFYP